MKKDKSNTKKKIGFLLLIIVILCWIAVPILPFFNFNHKAIIITSILIGGEVLFVITIALLGKSYWEKIKKNVINIFSPKKEEELPGDFTVEKDVEIDEVKENPNGQV